MQAAYPYIWYFFIYAFLGWCAEVIFAAARKGVFVNRGFLNGPLCPIYGVGLVAVVALLAPARDSLGLLYLGAVLLTSAIELVTGFLMEKLFHQRWWDYSQMPFNIGGYVCLLFSLIWGLACLLIVDVVHPLVAGLVARIPQKLGWPLLAAFFGHYGGRLCGNHRLCAQAEPPPERPGRCGQAPAHGFRQLGRRACRWRHRPSEKERSAAHRAARAAGKGKLCGAPPDPRIPADAFPEKRGGAGGV